MALQSQNVVINFGKGLDTKTDPKQVIPGKLITLENGIFKTINEIRKRDGYGIIGSNIGQGNSVTPYNSELIANNTYNAYSYDQKRNTFESKGVKLATDLSVQSIVRNAYQQTTQDSSINQNISAYAWEDSSGGVRCSVYDVQTGQAIVVNQLLSVTATRPKIKSIGNYIVIFFAEEASNTLKYTAINITTPTTIPASSTLSAAFKGIYPAYDVCVLNNVIYGVFNNNSAAVLSTFTLDSNLNMNQVNHSSEWANVVTCYPDTVANVVYFSYVNISSLGVLLNALKYFTLDSSLNFVLNITGIGTFVDVRNLTGYAFNNAGRLYYEVYQTYTDSNNSNNYILQSSLTGSGTVSNLGVYSRSVGLISKTFLDDVSTQPYNIVAHESALQNTYFILDQSANVVGKIAYQNGGGLTSKISHLTEVNLVSTNSFRFAYLIKDQIESVVNGLFTTTGVNSANLQFKALIESEQIANDLTQTGSLITMYDGATVCEQGFNLFPEGIGENLSSNVTTNVGGALSAATYFYKSTYEWMDNQGQLHRSAPSPAISAVVSSAAITFTGDTNTSTHILNVPSIIGLGIGMPVTGTNVAANSVITLIEYNFFGGGFSRVTLNNLTTGTTSGITFSATPQEFISATYVAGSKLMLASNSSQIYITGAYSNGYITTDAETAPYISSGNTMLDIYSNTSYTVVSVVGTAITVTPAPTAPPFSSSYFKVTNGSTFPAAATLRIGQVVQKGTDFPAGTRIVSVKQTGITADVTLNQAPTASGSSSSVVLTNLFANTIMLPTLRLTAKVNSPVQIVLYRIAPSVDNITYRQCSSFTYPNINDKTVDYFPLVDGLSDDELVFRNQLYTIGGEVENIAPPAASSITSFKNRAVLIPAENPTSWWYSKQVIQGTPLEFNDSFKNSVDQKDGAIIAPAVLDDKLILFKQNTIFYVVGNGPTPGGTLNDFSEAQLITTDVGLADKRSIVSMPYGLMFKSSKGIYILKRDLQVEYIGSDVEFYNSQTVTSAVLLNNQNQVRFTLSSGVVLAFDYYVGQWSVFTGYSAIGSCVFQSKYSHIDSSGNINQETPGTYNDNSAFIKLKLVLSWLSFAQLQGYERIWKLLLLGEYKSPHNLIVSMAYNFISTLSESKTIPVLSSIIPYQFGISLARQKCEALQIQIEDAQSSSAGESLSISAISLEVGVKKGLNKMPASVSY